MKVSLTKADIEKLMCDPSPAARADTVGKIASHFGSGEFSDGERRLAEEIFRILARDVEVQVREALSVHLKECPQIPHDIALSLAKDVDSVAIPVIEFSQVLTDDDLVEIINASDAAKQSAVARRETVSESVSDALVDTRNEDVVATLMDNEGAEISDRSFEKAIVHFGASEKVNERMAYRATLPIGIAERLVTMVSDKLKERLATHHELSSGVTTDLILGIRERATLSLVRPGAESGDVEKLVRQLHENSRLTPSIILRALCMGDMAFFEAAVARRAGVPVVNARLLIYDEGELGLNSIYKKALLPDALLPAVKMAVEVAEETGYDGQENDRERFTKRMIERVLTQFEDMDIGSDNLEYLLAKLNGFASSETMAPR
ncbi:MAG: DUF2336 domain-containing protein [Proteobacteria bacterium]|nr:DUF2336 domain-containing protein [Pseudomonadota bacterium]